jgi:hypothetical protein
MARSTFGVFKTIFNRKGHYASFFTETRIINHQDTPYGPISDFRIYCFAAEEAFSSVKHEFGECCQND